MWYQFAPWGAVPTLQPPLLTYPFVLQTLGQPSMELDGRVATAPPLRRVVPSNPRGPERNRINGKAPTQPSGVLPAPIHCVTFGKSLPVSGTHFPVLHDKEFAFILGSI